MTSYEQAASLLGAEEQGAAELVRLILRNGAAAVVVAPAADQEGYEAAFGVLSGLDGLSLVVCDSTDQQVQQKLRDSVAQAAGSRRERIAVVAGSGGQTVSQLVERAKALNSERVVLVAPGVLDRSGAAASGTALAAAVAGAIAGEADPAVPLGGAVLYGLGGLETRYDDSQVDLLIQGGVTPVEEMGGVVSVIRGVTTRTTTGGAADRTWRELSTILIVDDVIPTLRTALRGKFRRAKNSQQSRGAIRSQVILELENKRSREIIAGYDNVTVRADEENPTVCVVEFSFTVTHGLNQIWLSAHITV